MEPQGEAMADAETSLRWPKPWESSSTEANRSWSGRCSTWRSGRETDRLPAAPSEMLVVDQRDASLQAPRQRARGFLSSPSNGSTPVGERPTFDPISPGTSQGAKRSSIRRCGELALAAGESVSLADGRASQEYVVAIDKSVVPGTVQVIKGLFEAPANAFDKGSRSRRHGLEAGRRGGRLGWRQCLCLRSSRS